MVIGKQIKPPGASGIEIKDSAKQYMVLWIADHRAIRTSIVAVGKANVINSSCLKMLSLISARTLQRNLGLNEI